MVWTNPAGMVAMIDGNVSPAYQNILDINFGGVRFIDANTLRFYGVENGQVYRVRLSAGGS